VGQKNNDRSTGTNRGGERVLYFLIFKLTAFSNNHMTKHKISFPALFLATFLSVTFISCNNNSGNIPFPEKELGYSQPVSIPLQFSEEKKINWDTAKQGGIKPVIKKLDIQALPSKQAGSNLFPNHRTK
jgi:hypothetical protein